MLASELTQSALLVCQAEREPLPAGKAIEHAHRDILLEKRKYLKFGVRLLHFKSDFPYIGLLGLKSGNIGVEILAIASPWLFFFIPSLLKGVQRKFDNYNCKVLIK